MINLSRTKSRYNVLLAVKSSHRVFVPLAQCHLQLSSSLSNHHQIIPHTRIPQNQVYSTKELARSTLPPTTPHRTTTSNNKLVPPLDPPPRRPQPIDAPLLVLAQPGLQRLAQHALPDEVDDEPADDADEGDGVHPVDVLVEDLDADDDAPEVARQQADVEEGGRGEAEHERRARVEDEQAERVARQVAADFAVAPHGLPVARPVEDAAHGAVDDGAPEPQLAHDLVERPLAHEELLGHVAHAVEGGAHQREEVALELVAARDAAEAGPLGDVVRAEEDADAADADEDADDLGRVVADAEENRGDEDDHDDGPEVDKLSGEDGPVGLLALQS